MSKKHLYEVETITTFRHVYVIEAKELDHAYDEVTMLDSGNPDDMFEHVTQRCLGETIVSGRKITQKHFKKMLKSLETDENEHCSYWMGKDLIRKINYLGEDQ